MGHNADMSKRFSFCVAACLLSAVSFSQVGLRAGMSFFSSQELRNAFGNERLSFGISPMGKTYAGGYRVGPDLDVNITSRNGNRLLLIPLTYGITTGLNRTEAFGRDNVLPYVAARAGIAYTDYAIWRGSSRISETRLLPTANLEAGLVFNRNLTLSARYNIYTKTKGFDFNGLTIGATWTIIGN